MEGASLADGRAEVQNLEEGNEAGKEVSHSKDDSLVTVNGAICPPLAVPAKLQQLNRFQDSGGLHQEAVLRLKDQQGEDSAEVAHLLAGKVLKKGVEIGHLAHEKEVGRWLE